MALSLSDYSALKEIQSLDNMIKKHLDAISSEESRKDNVLNLRAKRETEKVGFQEKTKENGALISCLEKELFDWEKKRRQAELNQERASDQKQAEALEKEINQITPRCEELEEKVLNLLEENECLDTQVAECDEFLKGSLKTLEQIDKEITEETQVERQQISNYEERITALLESIPQELRNAFKLAREKHRFNMPLARIVNRSCEKCRFQVDSQTLSLIDQAKTISHCDQCQRLLIPFDA